MSLWKWNDVELEIDMEDIDFQQKYEVAFSVMEMDEKELQKAGKLSDFSVAYCNMFFKLFDGIFGKGTSEKLFDGKKNTRTVEECYDSFITACKKDVEAANKRRVSRVAKYRPKSSR